MSNKLVNHLIDGEIFVRASAYLEAKTPLVMLMGYSGTVDSWTEGFLARLAAERPILAVDLPGNGRSVKEISKERLAYGAVTDDLEKVMSHFGVRAAHVLGYSYGGTIAMSFAKAKPGRVKSLTLVATTLGGAQYVSPPREILQELGAPGGSTLEEKTEAIWRICLGSDKMPAFRTLMLEILERQKAGLTPSWVLREQLKNYLSFSFAADAAKTTLPVAVISGDEDPLTPVDNSRRIAAAFPAATLVELAGCRHMPHVEAPEAFARAILDKLETFS